MIQKTTKHLDKLMKSSSALRRQFLVTPQEKESTNRAVNDPLLEDSKYHKTQGLVHKYNNRVLIVPTLTCFAYCRFCTRKRKVDDLKYKLAPADIKKIVEYIKENKDNKEAIISGGDPLTQPKILIDLLNKLSKIDQIKIIRIHTRAPVSQPSAITPSIVKSLAKIKKQAVYVGIHFEHPDELCKETLQAIVKLKKAGAILFSQSVFLKDVNDDYKTLHSLFTQLSQNGVYPYMMSHCDLVKGAQHFIVPIEKEIQIMTLLRKSLSGIAFPVHVIDAPLGKGKVPVPQDFWQFNKNQFFDFDGKNIFMY